MTKIKTPSNCYFTLDDTAIARMAAVALDVIDGIYANEGYILIDANGEARQVEDLPQTSGLKYIEPIDIVKAVLNKGL